MAIWRKWQSISNKKASSCSNGCYQNQPRQNKTKEEQMTWLNFADSALAKQIVLDTEQAIVMLEVEALPPPNEVVVSTMA